MKKINIYPIIFSVLVLLSHSAFSKSTTNFLFLSKVDSSKLLQTDDSFISRISPVDIDARVGKRIDKDEFISFVSKQAIEWTAKDKEALNSIIADTRVELKRAELAMYLPNSVKLIKTNGREEFNAAYTRENAIILPIRLLESGNHSKISEVFKHELFHVMSRTSDDFRDKLYAQYGYKSLNSKFTLPNKLILNTITNPDSRPGFSFYIDGKLNNKSVKLIPFIYYDNDSEKFMFKKVTAKFLVLDKGEKFLEVVSDDLASLSYDRTKFNIKTRTLEEHVAYQFPKLISK